MKNIIIWGKCFLCWYDNIISDNETFHFHRKYSYSKSFSIPPFAKKSKLPYLQWNRKLKKLWCYNSEMFPELLMQCFLSPMKNIEKYVLFFWNEMFCSIWHWAANHFICVVLLLVHVGSLAYFTTNLKIFDKSIP